MGDSCAVPAVLPAWRITVAGMSSDGSAGAAAERLTSSALCSECVCGVHSLFSLLSLPLGYICISFLKCNEELAAA